MEKIVNYIKNGKGIGFIFLLAVAVLITLIITIKFKEFSVPIREEIVTISKDFLPITVSEGKIISPTNTYIRKDIKLSKNDNEDSFPIVLDTRSETSSIPSEKYGIFIMTDQVYMVAKNEIKKLNLNDGTINQEVFEKKLNSFMGSIFFIFSILYIVILSLSYLLEVLIATGIGHLFIKYHKQTDKYTFSSLMRLNSLIVAGLELIIGLSRMNVHLFIFMAIVIVIQLIFINNDNKI
jgi:hypothetical protein